MDDRFLSLLMPPQLDDYFFCNDYLCKMKLSVLVVFLLAVAAPAFAQVSINTLHADYVTEGQRQRFDAYLHDTVIGQALQAPLDGDGEYGYETACLAASQFMIKDKQLEAVYRTIISQWGALQLSTKMAFLESVFGLYPGTFAPEIKKLLAKEKQSKLFAMEAAYLLEKDTSAGNKAYLLKLVAARFADYTKNTVLLELRDYINNHNKYLQTTTPPIIDFFNNQKTLHQKTIYSFQRWNRDYPGLAIIQNTNGSFAKDSSGKLAVFRQLARAAGNLPYFITDGNTPQGIYSITGLRVSQNHFLGPTPNIQMVMPFEDDQAFWGDSYDSRKDALGNYLGLFPASWQNYRPITEVFYAGKAGRSAIICHGTTLNPRYFTGKPYYPISPTLGCLCAAETWDASNGKLKESDQLRLVNTFLATPEDNGYVIVINLNNKQLPVSRLEIEQLVNDYNSK